VGVFNTFTLTLIVYDYPRFTTPVISLITMHVNGNVNYTLPVFNETGLTLTSTTMPAFAQIYNNTFDFNFLPIAKTHVGVFTVDGVISNPYLSTKYSYTVKVLNDPPFFDSPLPTSVLVK
jgi:hypothetical protein